MNLVDSCGWLEYFDDGLNADFFDPAITDAANLVVPTICLYEVFRRMHDQRGRRAAMEAVVTMRAGKIIPLNEEIAIEAARLGLELKLPLADSVIMATAQTENALVWTQDVHFEKIPGVRFIAKK